MTTIEYTYAYIVVFNFMELFSSGKERDEETGFSYFGARHYNPALSIWLSVDPLSDKYPGLSPYVYCANNPVKLVDPDGREIVLKGEDGNHIYNYGSKCNSTDKNVQVAWANLDKIHETKAGETVIEKMTNENTPTFVFTNESLKNDGTGRFKKDGHGGGTMYMGGELRSAGYLAHELFHGYQEINGQGGASIHNEVEANLFAALTTGFFTPLQPRNQTKSIYGDAYMMFYIGSVNTSNFDSNFKNLRTGFKSYSRANFDGKYAKYSLGENNKSLLKQFYK